MSATPPTTPPSQTSHSATYTPSPSTTPPSSHCSPTPTSVNVTYRVVGIKSINSDWLTPKPSDLIQITGSLAGVNTPISDGEDAAAEEDPVEIPCEARLTWGKISIHLTCLYYPSAPLFTDFGECKDETVDGADEAERLKSVSVTMQSAICSGEEMGGEMAEDEDVRDDDGNPLLVLHVNEGLDGSARLYCKKVTDGQNGLTDAVGESLGLGKNDEDMDEGEDTLR